VNLCDVNQIDFLCCELDLCSLTCVMCDGYIINEHVSGFNLKILIVVIAFGEGVGVFL